MKTYYFDMDGVLANFHKEPYKYTNAINTEWIANLEPFMNNIRKVQQLIKNGNNVYILSKAAAETSRQGKIQWLAKYLPQIAQDHIIIIVGNDKKINYIKEDGILVDDDMKNIKPWQKANQHYIYIENKGDTALVKNIA